MRKVSRLFENFKPDNYKLFIDPDRDSRTINGTVIITGKKTGRPSQRLTLHQNDLKITEATITRHDKKGDQSFNVERINHQNKLNEVRLHTKESLYAGAYTISLKFEGEITDSAHGVYACNYKLNGQDKALIATDLESHHAREIFPCIDEPEAKATFELTLVSPKNEIALSNSPAKNQTEKDGKLITEFEVTPKMSTYLLCFVYGDLQHKTAKTKDGVDVKVWTTKAHSMAALDFGLETAKKGIEFFNEYYGVPYPLPKCDLVALPDYSMGAMENWGLITFREICLIAEPSTSSQSSLEGVATVITHELAHQWFGDLVTMKWWDDLWLNESFANVMEYLAADALHPEWHCWNTFTGQEGLSAIRRDAITGVQAVKTEVRHPDEISTLFDPSIVYAKGGRLLNMLMNYVGENDFRKGLKLYFEKNAYGNTTGNDLWDALSKASGKDIGALMTPWLEQSGYPVVRVNQQGTSLKISQQHFLLDQSRADKSRIWPVPLLASSKEIPELLDKQELDITLKNDEFIRINQGAIGHYIVYYENPEHAAHLAKQAEKQTLSDGERLMLLSDSSMLSRAGIQPFTDTLELLKHYSKEQSEPVWDIISLVLADCRRFIGSNDKLDNAIKGYVRELIESEFKRLTFEEKPGEPSSDTKLRALILALGVYSGHPVITRQALALFAAYKDDPDVVPSEQRSVVFGAAVRNNHGGAVDFLLDTDEKTANLDLKQDILSALTSTLSVEVATKLLKRVTDPKKVRQHDVHAWIAYLLRNRYTQKYTWQWLRDNWPWIEKSFASDKAFDYFPRSTAGAFNTRELADEYKEFFAPLRHWTELARNIDMGIEELSSRIAWLERDKPAVVKYFKADQ